MRGTIRPALSLLAIEFARKVADLQLRLRGDELMAAIAALREERQAAEAHLLSKLPPRHRASQRPQRFDRIAVARHRKPNLS